VFGSGIECDRASFTCWSLTPRTCVETPGTAQDYARLWTRAADQCEHLEHGRDIVFRCGCKLDFEGIVSKGLGSPYIFRHTRHWLKIQETASAAVKREAEEDLGKNG
jgi:hypothetical protein